MHPINKQLREDIQKLITNCVLESNHILNKRNKKADDFADAEAYMHMASGLTQALHIVDGYLKNYYLKINPD